MNILKTWDLLSFILFYFYLTHSQKIELKEIQGSPEQPSLPIM